jgi:hypothetical protein
MSTAAAADMPGAVATRQMDFGRCTVTEKRVLDIARDFAKDRLPLLQRPMRRTDDHNGTRENHSSLWATPDYVVSVYIMTDLDDSDDDEQRSPAYEPSQFVPTEIAMAPSLAEHEACKRRVCRATWIRVTRARLERLLSPEP